MTELDKLADWFPDDVWPSVSCPVCQKGELITVNVVVIESTESRRAQAHEWWEPDCITGLFTAQLRCQRRSCAEVVVAIGKMRVGHNAGARGWDDQYVRHLQLQHMSPAPSIVAVVESCPEAVRARLDEAARVIWSDPSAAANRLRLAVEQVLDDQGVPRVNSKGSGLKTHDRIMKFRKQNQRVADALEAVKWIGNQGSHEDSLTQIDVINGARILAHALELLYDTRPEEIRRLVEGINAAGRVPDGATTTRV